jgi:polyisoprenoid-binding protein YceI
MRHTPVPRSLALSIACGTMAATALAAPVTYEIDSDHTYPAFEADHLGGVSRWRGKINSTSGTVTLDKEAQSGSVDVTMDMTTIDFGHEGLNDHAQTPDLFDTAQHPTATYTGRLTNFRDGEPTAVEGTLTMRGVSRPVSLNIDHFVCQPHPMSGREVCGADASATIDRADFGVDFLAPPFLTEVLLRISIEALAPEE